MVGSALVPALVKEGHTVCRLVRPQSPSQDAEGEGFAVTWDPATGELGGAAVGPDAVVHLAGASVADGRWTAKRKELLRSSRIEVTRSLVKALERMNVKPSVLISASAIGYYGNRGDELLTEESGPGQDFLAELAQDWEAEAKKAELFKTRVVFARFGIILAKNGGALPKMAMPFRFGFGGKLGDGSQWMSWIALEDVIGILQLCLSNAFITGAVKFAPVRGAVNVVSPQPVTNAEFTKELSNALHRPALLSVPKFALKLAMGEMADAVLASQRVIPARLEQLGYRFRFPDLGDALQNCLR